AYDTRTVRSSSHFLSQQLAILLLCFPVILVVGSRSVHDILKRTGLLSYLGKGFVAPTFADGLKLGFHTFHRLQSDERLHLPKLPPSKRRQSRHAHHPHQHHKSRNK
ncbi:hypothetical protein, partial [uncultured Desulfovibrio sp.]|uniref:hypothetical protein n=1 Tax=uncultured Desulfovibrio sp. TaxID=167968 RepID=UPI00261238F5